MIGHVVQSADYTLKIAKFADAVTYVDVGNYRVIALAIEIGLRTSGAQSFGTKHK